MSRSPLSPAGKRLKTMDDDLLDDLEDPSPSVYDNYPNTDDELYMEQYENYEISLMEQRQNRRRGKRADNDNDDDDDEDDDDEDDDDDGGDASSYSQDSLSSGYAGLNDDIPGVFVEEDDDDDDYIDYDTEDDDDIDHSRPDEYLKHDPTPETQYPKPNWITTNELRQRKCGLPSSRFLPARTNMYWFERYASNSLWMIQRLELSKRLEEHTGCVNSLDFNSNGRYICSGSDDLAVCIWDWQIKKLKKKIITGHTNNIIHSQFCNSDTNIITASRDGTVRLLNIENSLSELLMSQSGEVDKLAFLTPQTLVTCGTNASVNFIDLRVREPTKLFIVRNPKNNRSCALHSINSHPLDKHKIAVAGASPYVFLYDLRRVARNPNDVEHKPTHCLDNFENTNIIVTSTAFNSTGSNLLISYNDDDLVLCRTDTCEIVHTYKGHRNKKTIKGCAWFGDNFVMSGSDDGHIYGWDLESEHIVCFLEGDVKGVVNCLTVHPNIPVLASSGLDHNVKVWEPTSKTWPQTLKGIKPQICKNTMRRKRAQDRRTQIFHSRDEGDSDADL